MSSSKTKTNLVQKKWIIEEIANYAIIYNVCPGPYAIRTYLFGDFRSHTIIATENLAKVYDIVPYKDGNDWDQDSLYFVGSLGYNVIWKYSLLLDNNNIAWYNLKLKDKNIILKLVIKIKDSDYFYIAISTLNFVLFCEFNLQSVDIQKCEQYIPKEIHTIIESSPILLLGKL